MSVPIDHFAGFPESFDRDYRAPRRPAIVSGAVDDWPARRWTPRTLREDFGDVETPATVQLPQSGVVYLQTEKAHRRTMTVRELVDLMAANAPCYIDQADIVRFPGLEAACRIDALVSSGRRFINLWVGAKTRSGLHYDPMDNYLIQIYGAKEAILAPPSARRWLYPFSDNIAKSRVDPEELDLTRFPKAARVVFSTGTLQPGDLLYIPRGWWHFLRAPEQSISLNLWHEPALSLADELASIAAVGPRGWMRVGRDFVVHGALNRPYERRLYSPPPTGKQIYDLCKLLLKGKALP
jgi:Cupin-like domain